MSYTRAQLVTKALSKLGVIAEGQVVSASDLQKMDDQVEAAFELLNGLDIYYVADYGTPGPTGGNIDDAAFLPLATWLANEACEDFNMPADQQMDAATTQAVARLRTLAAPPRANTRLRVDNAVRGRNRGQWGRFPNNG